MVRLECPSCAAEVNGLFDLCPTCRLGTDDRRLFDLFLDARGNLKGVQRALGVSYPTVRLRMEELFQRLGRESTPADPGEVLERLRSGELTVAEAERLLRGHES